MHQRLKALLGMLSFVLSGVGACKDAPRADTDQLARPAARDEMSREPLQPLPPAPDADPRLLALGGKLFHDRRLSADGTVSCASCHDLTKGGGADTRPRSVGTSGARNEINALTVYNAGYNFVQFWDGRSPTLEDQVNGPVGSPLDFGSSWDEVLAKISADPDYRARFGAVFQRGVTAENVRGAIAAFERSLVTSGSPFDRWLQGDEGALTTAQVAGYETFKSVGCIACHQGRNVGGNMFQRFGMFGNYFTDRGHVTKADYGRFNVTGQEADRFVFRVPSLRLAARTAPYFHDGSAATLPDAIQIMARYQLGRALTNDQVVSIVAFITSLAGTEPATVELE